MPVSVTSLPFAAYVSNKLSPSKPGWLCLRWTNPLGPGLVLSRGGAAFRAVKGRAEGPAPSEGPRPRAPWPGPALKSLSKRRDFYL